MDLRGKEDGDEWVVWCRRSTSEMDAWTEGVARLLRPAGIHGDTTILVTHHDADVGVPLLAPLYEVNARQGLITETDPAGNRDLRYVSPVRAVASANAATAHLKQAEAMAGRHGRALPTRLDVGAVVYYHAPTSKAWSGRNAALTCVVLGAGACKDLYRLKTKEGKISGAAHRNLLVFAGGMTPQAVGISMASPSNTPVLTVEDALRMAHGLPHAPCSCKSLDCATSNTCRCRKAGVLCDSRCHGGNGGNPNCCNMAPTGNSHGK
jgi:hypothetical protein